MTKAWLENKSTILGYYQNRRMPLTQVRDIMKIQHGFEASPRAFRQQFKNWGIRKYNRKDNRDRFSRPVHGAEASGKRAQFPATRRLSRHLRPLYVTSPSAAAQDTPRPAHAHLVGRIDGQMITPVTYPSPSPTSSMPYVDDSLANSTLLLSPNTPREQYQYPGARHSMPQADKTLSNTSDTSEVQKTGRLESPPMYLYPTTESSTSAKATQWQPTYRSPYPQPASLEPVDDRLQSAALRKTSMNWHSATLLDKKPSDDHFQETGAVQHTSNGSPYKYQSPPATHTHTANFADYSSEYQDKPYGSPNEQSTQSQFYPKQSSIKQRVWGISDIATGSVSAYKTQHYQLPSPPHSQPHLSLSAAKVVDEQSASTRTSPPSPSSQPDMSIQVSLHREQSMIQNHENGSVYPSDILPVAMAYPRSTDAFYDATTSSPCPVSTPSLSSAVTSPSAISTSSHHAMYPYSAY